MLVNDEVKEPIVRRVVERLAARYPEAPRPYIAGIVGEEYDALDSGRIRTYIPPWSSTVPAAGSMMCSRTEPSALRSGPPRPSVTPRRAAFVLPRQRRRT